MDLIEAEGPQAVSMTRLATELGCGLVPLYNQVPSTSALLDGIAATIMSGLDDGPTVGADWAVQMRAQARAIRQAARAYPRCSVAVAGREPATAAQLRPTEHALAILREIGGAVGTGREFDGDDDRRPRPRPAEFPHVTSLAVELTLADSDADFELGIELLVLGIDALLAVRAGR